MTVETEEIHQRIRDRAYYLWLAEGAPAGREDHFWLLAESSESPRADDPRARLLVTAAHAQGLGEETKPFLAPPGLGYSHDIDLVTGIAFTRLTNGRADAGSTGPTGGYSVRLPDGIEAAASGRRVVVAIVARAANGDESRFALAYSTNDVGNSRWRWFTVGPQWSVCQFEYDVPRMNKGNGDYVGVLPDSRGQPGVDVCFLAIEIS
jgi:hypothetical protein